MLRGFRGYADSPAFTLKYPPAREQTGKLRIVVSGKLTKRATQRNLIKRRLRHLWRVVGNGLPPHIYVKKAALNMSFSELKDELARALKKI